MTNVRCRGVLFFLSSLLVSVPVAAQAPPSPSGGVGTGVSMAVETIEPVVDRLFRHWFVPFQCGEIPAGESPEMGSPLAPGSYRTLIMVTNGQFGSPATVDHSTEVALPLSEPTLFLPPSGGLVLDSFRTLAVDCERILRGYPPPRPAFVMGSVFVGVERDDPGASRKILVRAIYTVKNVDIIPALPPNEPPPN